MLKGLGRKSVKEAFNHFCIVTSLKGIHQCHAKKKLILWENSFLNFDAKI